MCITPSPFCTRGDCGGASIECDLSYPTNRSRINIDFHVAHRWGTDGEEVNFGLLQDILDGSNPQMTQYDLVLLPPLDAFVEVMDQNREINTKLVNGPWIKTFSDLQIRGMYEAVTFCHRLATNPEDLFDLTATLRKFVSSITYAVARISVGGPTGSHLTHYAHRIIRHLADETNVIPMERYGKVFVELMAKRLSQHRMDWIAHLDYQSFLDFIPDDDILNELLVRFIKVFLKETVVINRMPRRAFWNRFVGLWETVDWYRGEHKNHAPRQLQDRKEITRRALELCDLFLDEIRKREERSILKALNHWRRTTLDSTVALVSQDPSNWLTSTLMSDGSVKLAVKNQIVGSLKDISAEQDQEKALVDSRAD